MSALSPNEHIIQGVSPAKSGDAPFTKDSSIGNYGFSQAQLVKDIEKKTGKSIDQLQKDYANQLNLKESIIRTSLFVLLIVILLILLLNVLPIQKIAGGMI